MAMRPKQLIPRVRIRKLAADPESIRIYERKYIVAISKFVDQLDDYRELLSGLKIFTPFIDDLDQIEKGLEEGMTWLLDSLDKKLEYGQLLENLKDNVASELESLLDIQQSLDLDRRFTPGIGEEVIGELELLTERYWESVRKKGYDLYHVLIGAA